MFRPLQYDQASQAAADAGLRDLVDDNDIEELFDEVVLKNEDFRKKGEFVKFCRWFSILKALCDSSMEPSLCILCIFRGASASTTFS